MNLTNNHELNLITLKKVRLSLFITDQIPLYLLHAAVPTAYSCYHSTVICSSQAPGARAHVGK